MNDSLENYKHVAPNLSLEPERIVRSANNGHIAFTNECSPSEFQICVYDQNGIEQEPCIDSVEARVGGRPAKLSIEDGKLIAR